MKITIHIRAIKLLICLSHISHYCEINKHLLNEHLRGTEVRVRMTIWLPSYGNTLELPFFPQEKVNSLQMAPTLTGQTPILGKAQADNILWRDDNALMKRYQVTYEVKRDLQLFLHWDVREHLFDAMFWILSLLLGSMAFSLGQAAPQEANWFYSTLGDSTTPSWMHPSSTEDFLYKYVQTLSQAGVTVFTQAGISSIIMTRYFEFPI